MVELAAFGLGYKDGGGIVTCDVFSVGSSDNSDPDDGNDD